MLVLEPSGVATNALSWRGRGWGCAHCGTNDVWVLDHSGDVNGWRDIVCGIIWCLIIAEREGRTELRASIHDGTKQASDPWTVAV